MPATLTIADWTALAIFLTAWLIYEPLLKAAGRPGGLINSDMTVIRRVWMRNSVVRENQYMDGQLLAQVLNSSSFFASSNLILIAGAASTLFHGDESYKSAASLVVMSSRKLFEGEIGLIMLTLARGLLAFIWSIRQLHYCLAALGAAPRTSSGASAEAYADAVARLLNPALSSFSAGVRGYYFAAAAAAWLFGPWAFMGATIVALAVLFWRQKLSPAAAAIASIRAILDETRVDPKSNQSTYEEKSHAE
jgi:uncharacterized membrane protein